MILQKEEIEVFGSAKTFTVLQSKKKLSPFLVFAWKSWSILQVENLTHPMQQTDQGTVDIKDVDCLDPITSEKSMVGCRVRVDLCSLGPMKGAHLFPHQRRWRHCLHECLR
jgi:hypothetical protein